MTTFFLKIVDMSLTASWMILAVLILRLILKKAPKWTHVLLWGIVAIRLICPFSIESSVSLIPEPVGSGDTLSKWIADMDIHYMDTTDNQHASYGYDDKRPGTEAEQNLDRGEDSYAITKVEPLEESGTIEHEIISVFSFVWISGVILLVIYTIISYRRLNCKVHTAVRYRDNIFQSENVISPFVFGILRPRIYLPFHIDGQNLEHVLAHELAHIFRKDHWWKLLGFLLLTIHWFNPFMWFAYVLLCRDIELACDERVIKGLNKEQKADYTQALVACSVNRRMASACPLAFGEVGVKERVKLIMKYKKPGFWIVILSIISCFVLTACFLTDPKQKEDNSDMDVTVAEDMNENSGSDDEDDVEDNSALMEADQDKELSEQDKMVADIIYQLELSTMGKEFRDMDDADQTELLKEYGPLLDGFTLTARESVDGASVYVVGSYKGMPENNQLSKMGWHERWEEDRSYQLIYELEDKEVMMQEDYPEIGYEIENSRMTSYADNTIILIQPVEVELNLHDAMASYFWKGQDYIPDAVSRGISIHIPTGPYLTVYYISEKYGEISENIPLTEAEAQAMSKEEKISLSDGFGFGASLYIDGESEYYAEATGVPQMMVDLAVKRCGYRFETPEDITDDIVEARMDCSWLEEPIYVKKEDLARLKEILIGAEMDFVGGCGYNAKLTITLTNGEQMIMFKGCDSCDTMVFGSYGGYFLGDDENTEFWEIFGLDPETKEYR